MQNSKIQEIYYTFLRVFFFFSVIDSLIEEVFNIWFIYVENYFVLIAQGEVFIKQFSQSLVESFVQFVNTVYQQKFCPVGFFQTVRRHMFVSSASIAAGNRFVYITFERCSWLTSLKY